MKKPIFQILLVDRNETNSLIIKNILRQIVSSQFELDWVNTETAAKSAIKAQQHDVYLIDAQFILAIESEGITKLAAQLHPAPTIVLSESYQAGMDAIEAGASDYWYKNRLTFETIERSLRLTLANANNSETQLKRLIDAIPVCIAYVDRKQRYRFTNKSYRDWFGYKREDTEGQSLQEVLNDREYEVIRESVEKALSGEQIAYEIELAKPRQGIRDIRVALIPDFNQHSQVKGYFTTITDISLRKQAELKLQHRLILEKALAQVSKKLAGSEKVDFEEILGWLGVALSTNHVYFAHFRDRSTFFDEIYDWWDSNTQSHSERLKNLQIDQFPWWMERLRCDRNVVICDLNHLPATASAEKKFLESYQICSLLAVPIYNQDRQLWGTIGLNTRGSNRKYWLEEDAQLLRIVGQMIYSYYERRLAQEKLRASEALYAGIFNHSADGIFLTEIISEDRLLYEAVNPAYQESIDLSAEKIIGKTVAEVLPANIATLVEQQYRTCIASGEPTCSEYSMEVAGSLRTLRTILVPIRDERDRIIKLQGSARDITEERKAIAEYLSQLRYRHLLKSVTLKIRQSLEIEQILRTTVTELQKTLQADRVILFHLVADDSAKIIEEAVNGEFPSMLGETVSDSYYRDRLQDTYTEGFVHICNDVSAAGYPPCYREFLHKYQIRANLILPIVRRPASNQNLDRIEKKQENSKLWGLLCVQQCSRSRQWTSDEIELLQQLTGQLSIALAQAELLQQETTQRQELARSNAELEQFAYVASHDLQAPLQTVSTYAKLLERLYKDQLDAKADKFINYIVDGSQRMHDRINDLLEYSRVGRQQNQFDRVDFNLIIEQVKADLKAYIQQNQAEIICQGDFPTIVADSRQLVMLLQNLIGNGIKYRSQEDPKIIIMAEDQGNYWQFSIADNGIGIDSKYYDRIFQIFQRLHTQEEYPGTGIGLAICQKIIERHNGKIRIESELGKGSIFYFTIPK